MQAMIDLSGTGKSMRTQLYAAEEVWLKEYFEYCDDIFVSTEAQDGMAQNDITLPDVLCAMRNPTILSYEREWDGCKIVVRGRTCDDEEITVYGGFSSEMMSVSVSRVTKTG